MTMARGSLNSSAVFHIFSVCASTPDTASTTTMAESAAISADAGVVHEHVEAGGIEEIDLGFLPLDGGDGGGDGQLAVDLFLVVIGDGVAFVDPGQAAGGACRVK